jgi:hypothetical protein
LRQLTQIAYLCALALVGIPLRDRNGIHEREGIGRASAYRVTAGGIHDVIAIIKIVPGGGPNSRGSPIQIDRVTRTKFLCRRKHYFRLSSFIRLVIVVI